VSFASILALVYTAIVLLAELPSYISENYPGTHPGKIPVNDKT